MQDIEQHKSEDLSNTKDKIGKTFFFERGDGEIIATEEKEAWNLLHNSSNWARRDFKLIGVGTGDTYKRTAREAKTALIELSKEIDEVRQELARYQQTFDKLKYEVMVDDDDPRLLKAKERMTEVSDTLAELEKKHRKKSKGIIKEAFDAELAEARGNIEMPRNHDVVVGKNSDYDKETVMQYMKL